MTPENFCYWLQGYFELSGPDPMMSTQQLQIVKDHLKLVMEKRTPDRGSPFNVWPLDTETKTVISC